MNISKKNYLILISFFIIGNSFTTNQEVSQKAPFFIKSFVKSIFKLKKNLPITDHASHLQSNKSNFNLAQIVEHQGKEIKNLKNMIESNNKFMTSPSLGSSGVQDSSLGGLFNTGLGATYNLLWGSVKAKLVTLGFLAAGSYGSYYFFSSWFSLWKGQQDLKEGQQDLKEGQQDLKEGQQDLKEGQENIKNNQDDHTKKLDYLKTGQEGIEEKLIEYGKEFNKVQNNQKLSDKERLEQFTTLQKKIDVSDNLRRDEFNELKSKIDQKIKKIKVNINDKINQLEVNINKKIEESNKLIDEFKINQNKNYEKLEKKLIWQSNSLKSISNELKILNESNVDCNKNINALTVKISNLRVSQDQNFSTVNQHLNNQDKKLSTILSCLKNTDEIATKEEHQQKNKEICPDLGFHIIKN